MFGERIIRMLVGFFVSVYVVRYLGPDQFGLFSYALSFVGLFATLSTLGLDSIVVRELVKAPDRRDEILGSVFNLRIWGGVASIILLAVTIFAKGEDSLTTILILVIAATNIFQCLNVVEYYFQSKVESKFNVYVQSSSMLIAAVLKVVLILNESPLLYFAIVHASESLFMSAGYFIVYKKNNLNITKWYFKKDTAQLLLKDAWPLILSGIVISVYMKIDQVMIRNMLDDKQTGFYAAAVKLSEAWYFIPMAICTSLFPAIVNAKQMSHELYINRLQKLYDMLAAISIGIALPVTFLSTFIISILYGEKFLPAADVLTIYIWAGVAVFLGIASSQYLINENLTKLSFYRTFVGMVVNVILNLVLIPVYGIVGSAIATLVSYSMATFSIAFSASTREQLYMMIKSIFFVNIIKLLRRNAG
ncbi:MAG: flippase [Ignavibacteriales bacterium]|nr:MAG: flippase [Ignavibacteriales bacterium]